MRLHHLLLAAFLVPLGAASQAAAQLPAPVLQFDGTEEQQAQGRAVVVYKLSIANRASFAGDLFSPAPDLPPCGKNANASRTWVNVHDGDGSSARLYGFCAFKSAEDLGKLWFALPKDKPPPRSVYVTVTDRRTEVTVTSNSVRLPQAPAVPVVATPDLWKECQSETADQALRACTQIIEQRTEPGQRLAQAHNLRAVAHQRMGQADKAIADLDQAIQLMQAAGKSDWELAFTLFVRGKAHREKGDLERAIADQSESIRVAPGWDKAYSERGAIYFQKGDVERALADISKVISFRPDSPRVADSYAIRAMVHLRMGQPAQGLPDADRAIELRPRSSLGHYVRAKSLEALGRGEDAAAAKRTALELDPKIVEQMEEMEQWGKK